jgi:hypothetical protein
MSNIPPSIKSKLAQLATFPEKYSLLELAAELEILSMLVEHFRREETELTQSALKIE